MNELVNQYGSKASVLRQEIAGLTFSQLHAHPVPGTWSIHQIVVHLADCEGVFADRIKRVIAQDRPTLMSFDENLWMQRLGVEARSTEVCAALVGLIRQDLAATLHGLPVDAFNRLGVHSEIGEVTLADLLRKADAHFDHHLRFLKDKKRQVQRVGRGTTVMQM